jgi:hypothetical protein
MDMTKWKITPRVRRTYREGSAWEAVFDVQQKSGWGHDWHSMESFSSREDAQKFILDYQRAEGTLRETPLSSLETHVWKRFGTIWAELRSLWTKIGEVSNAVEKLAADRTDLSLRVNALEERITALANEVEACKPIPRRTTRRTYR